MNPACNRKSVAARKILVKELDVYVRASLAGCAESVVRFGCAVIRGLLAALIADCYPDIVTEADIVYILEYGNEAIIVINTSAYRSIVVILFLISIGVGLDAELVAPGVVLELLAYRVNLGILNRFVIVEPAQQRTVPEASCRRSYPS